MATAMLLSSNVARAETHLDKDGNADKLAMCDVTGGVVLEGGMVHA